eukprot:TRINITY_DN4822_c1_g1_i1.p1 TRINITY_DN4822_c1_g1~~TRINITY_DN4822_c1_g1_i1.p1  ORF type:complete len:776 (+),score=137.71 TRINITY_DN4822_c1_g1_i1:208-2535(+)
MDDFDATCPICLKTIKEAYVTVCGHSYCYQCITAHLAISPSCPTCKGQLSNAQIFPNFMLNNMLERALRQEQLQTHKHHLAPVKQLEESLLRNEKDLSIGDIDGLLNTLIEKKRRMEAQEKQVEAEVLLDFLESMKSQKERELERLVKEVHVLDADIRKVQKQHSVLSRQTGDILPPDLRKDGTIQSKKRRLQPHMGNLESVYFETYLMQQNNLSSLTAVVAQQHAQVGASLAADSLPTGPQKKRARISETNVKQEQAELQAEQEEEKEEEEEEEGYHHHHSNSSDKPSSHSAQSRKLQMLAKTSATGQRIHPNTLATVAGVGDSGAILGSARSIAEAMVAGLHKSAVNVGVGVGANSSVSGVGGSGLLSAASAEGSTVLEMFSKKLSKLVKYSEFEVVSTFKFCDVSQDMCVVSSISFDREDEFFAMGGLTKKIKVYEYNPFICAPSRMHFPVQELTSDARISCIRWSPYIKAHLASSGYNGVLSVWDVSQSQVVWSAKEHEKRIWAIDYALPDPSKMVSASDDHRVKLWTINQRRSNLTIDLGANVCGVRYNPTSAYHIAVASSDHNVYYYDLRMPVCPMLTLASHTRAVSHIDFLSPNELVSMSVDGSLKLWDLSASAAPERHKSQQTYAGHNNSRYFVGMCMVQGDYLVCGSEDNILYTYSKDLDLPILSHTMPQPLKEGEASHNLLQQSIRGPIINNYNSSIPSSASTHTGAPITMATTPMQHTASMNGTCSNSGSLPVVPHTTALCTKRDTPVLLAANSRGAVQLLRLN